MALKDTSQLKSKEYYASLLSNPYVQAALNTIARAEGTATTEQPYSTLYGFTTFDNYSDHPRSAISKGGITSTAAGKYQALSKTWDEVSKAVGLTDFSPTSQDIFAVARIDQRGGLEPLLKGDFNAFSDKVKKEWASFPGANYKGQGMRSAAQVEQWFKEYAAAAKNTPAMMNGFRQDPVTVKTIDGVRSLSKPLDQTKIPTPLSKEFAPFNAPRNVPAPKAAGPARLANQYGQYQRGTVPPVITPNKVNTFTFTPANIDPSRFAPQASSAELANQYSQYQRGTPATAPQDITPSRPTANIDPSRFSPGPSRAELANQYGQYRPGTVPQAPAQTVNVDRSRFNNSAAPQPNMTANDVRNSYFDQLAGRVNPPTFAPGPTTSQSVRDAQTALGERNRRDQFVRDVLRTGTEVTLAPPSVNVDQSRFTQGPSKAELANQYSQYQRGNVPSAQINPTVYDMVDVPQSRTIASQYASYGAGKMGTAPQVASTATQAAPSIPNVPQTVAPRSPSVQAPAVNAPMTEQQRIDKAIADMKVGIPPGDIYDQNAPGRSGFRGFGAGGFLGNLLTGNAGNMAGIEGGNRLPGLLGVIQGVVQNLGGPQQAAQAVQSVAPALGQVMGLPVAQQAAKAGNNMVIGRDAAGRIGWMADGALSGGARGAGWASNNPERFFGGYGGGYDPTPV